MVHLYPFCLFYPPVFVQYLSIYYDFPDIMVIIDSLSTPNRPLTFEEKSYEVEDF